MRTRMRSGADCGFAVSTTWGAGRSRDFEGRSTCSMSARSSTVDVAIIGAGVTGLSAAKKLSDSRSDLDFVILEASDEVGGRIRSDKVDGFILDRGFQVLLEAYPEQKRILDYERLDLQRFLPGANVFYQGGHHLVSDPVRRPQDTTAALFSPIGTTIDKAKVALLRAKIASLDLDKIFQRDEMTTEEYLRKEGFTDSMIDRFFRPFYQGIFLAPLREQSSRMFEFVFRMFLSEPASLPAKGMGAVPSQLAQSVNSRIRLNTKVKALSTDPSGGARVDTDNGQQIRARALIIATDAPNAKTLLQGGSDGLASGQSISAAGKGCICLYYASSEDPPIKKPILHLNGEGPEGGIVNNMCFPNQVAPAYAPEGRSLISATIVGSDDGRTEVELDRLVRQQMKTWWDPDFVNDWEYIRSYNIPFCQAPQLVPSDFNKAIQIDTGVFICGDHRSTPTANGAIESGNKAADAVLEYLQK